MQRKAFYAHSKLNSDRQNWQEIKLHLDSVARITSRLAEKIGLPHAGELIGLAHDLGKYSEAFQQYLDKVANDAAMEMEPDFSLKGSVDHSTAGAQVIATELAGGHAETAAQMLALCVASHHSGLIDCIAPDGADLLKRRLDKVSALSHRDEAWSQAEQTLRFRLTTLLRSTDVASEIDAALERIREKDNDDIIRPFKQGLLLRMLFSCLIDGDRIDTADFDNPRAASLRQHGDYVGWQALIDRLELELASFKNERWIDRLRREISGHCLAASDRPRGIFTLTVPTGGGKTLASLRFALHHALKWHMDRIIYVSPYISIVDQNAEVVRKILEPEEECDFASIVLEHHSSLTPDKESWRGSVLAENWDAPVVFTTAVQVLEALFGGGTCSSRKLHAFANSVIVFDEIQTLPVRMIHLFNNAVNFLVEQCGATVLSCTATQPLLHEVDKAKGAVRLAEDSELMPNAPQLFHDLKRYETFDKSSRQWNPTEVGDLAIEEMLSRGSCLVIVNTKRDALAIYMACKERLDALNEPMKEGCFVHLSTRMCPAHRLQALEGMKIALAQKKRVLCVSTQLIEAGVDIDFASVVRDLAGLDSIAQAAGRCNRNGDRASGRVHIVKMAEPLPKQLAELIRAQSNAGRVLADWRDDHPQDPFPLSDPAQMKQFFHHYFFERKSEMNYPVKISNMRDDTLLRMLGENYIAVEYAEHTGLSRRGFMQSFKTAADQFHVINKSTQGVIVPFGDEGDDLINALSAATNLAIEFQLLRKAQRFAVDLYQHEWDSLTRSQAIKEVQRGTGVFRLLKEYYSDEFGLTLDGSGRMESMIE